MFQLDKEKISELNKGEKMKTEIIVVLDRSGSMHLCESDVVGGFNAFIEEQKNGEGDAFITLAQFDNKYEIVYEQVPVDKVDKLNFQPRGGTALLDAVGRTIIASKSRLNKDRSGIDSVIFVVITDGEENSSIEFKKSQIAEMTMECENECGWKFVYLGANQDAFAEAGSMGFCSSGTMAYDSSKGTRSMFDSLSRGTSSYRSKSKKRSDEGGFTAGVMCDLNKEDFFDNDDREEQEKFGVNWKIDK